MRWIQKHSSVEDVQIQYENHCSRNALLNSEKLGIHKFVLWKASETTAAFSETSSTENDTKILDCIGSVERDVPSILRRLVLQRNPAYRMSWGRCVACARSVGRT